MWEAFREEFLALWSAALKQKKSGDLMPLALFGNGIPAGAEALQVGLSLRPGNGSVGRREMCKPSVYAF